MDKEIFVQNIKRLCSLRGVKPTIACRESGAGADLINQIERRGSVPSVERVQLLAQYLGVTVSELLGEPTPEGQTRAALTEHLAQSVKDRLSDEQKEPTPVGGDGQGRNIIKIAGRDGSLIERRLTDDQVAALKLMLAQLPEVDDL